MTSPEPFHESVSASTAWTDVLSTSRQSGAYRAYHKITMLMQNDDDGGAVDFRVRGRMRSDRNSIDSRYVTVREYLSRTSSVEPDTLITEFEFTEYLIQARAASGTRTVSAHMHIYDRDGDDN